jgi:hypothetical protein
MLHCKKDPSYGGFLPLNFLNDGMKTMSMSSLLPRPSKGRDDFRGYSGFVRQDNMLEIFLATNHLVFGRLGFIHY